MAKAEEQLDREPTAKRPPADGRQDHRAMRAAAMLPISGPASTDTLAASGGLDVPGQEPVTTAHRAADLPKAAPAPEPIPGAYEPNTATHREPGAIGGQFSGADSRSADPHALMDERTVRERRREGGGGEHHG